MSLFQRVLGGTSRAGLKPYNVMEKKVYIQQIVMAIIWSGKKTQCSYLD